MVSENVSSYNGTAVRITASFGVVGFIPSPHNQKMTHKAIIDCADKALYQAKNDGRNRVRGKRLLVEQLP
jgi:diguanylate cyclase (GGDEF)-like protein